MAPSIRQFLAAVAVVGSVTGVGALSAGVANAAPAPTSSAWNLTSTSTTTAVVYVYTPQGRKLAVPAGSTWALLPDGSTWAIVTKDGSTWATVKKVGAKYVVQPGSLALRKF